MKMNFQLQDDDLPGCVMSHSSRIQEQMLPFLLLQQLQSLHECPQRFNSSWNIFTQIVFLYAFTDRKWCFYDLFITFKIVLNDHSITINGTIDKLWRSITISVYTWPLRCKKPFADSCVLQDAECTQIFTLFEQWKSHNPCHYSCSQSKVLISIQRALNCVTFDLNKLNRYLLSCLQLRVVGCKGCKSVHRHHWMFEHQAQAALHMNLNSGFHFAFEQGLGFKITLLA